MVKSYAEKERVFKQLFREWLKENPEKIESFKEAEDALEYIQLHLEDIGHKHHANLVFLVRKWLKSMESRLK